MSDPLYTIAVEFVTGSYTNVTSDCLHFSFARELATYDRGLSMGTCELIMQNEERKYSPANSASPYYPNLKPNRRVQVQATYASSTYNLFSGYLDNYNVNPIVGNRTVYLRASDRVKIMNMQDIDLPFHTDYNVGSLVTDILSSLAVNSADRVIDAIADTVPFAWFAGRKGTDSLNDLLTYGNYQAFVGGDGKVNVKNRYHQIEGIASITASINEYLDLNYTLDESDIGNIIKVGGSPRKVATSIATIAWLQTIETIPASGYASFWLNYIDPLNNEINTPANSVVFPVASTDFLFNTQSDGAGSNLTATSSVNGILFGTTAVFSLFNGSGNIAYITKFNVRGYPVQRQSGVSYQQEVSSSQTEYGKRTYTIESDLINGVGYAKDYVAFLLYSHKDPTDHLTVSLKNQWGQQLGMELGNLVHIVESQTAINSIFSVMNIDHQIELTRGLEHTTTYELELWKDRSWLILNHAVYGLLDSRRLAF